MNTDPMIALSSLISTKLVAYLRIIPCPQGLAQQIEITLPESKDELRDNPCYLEIFKKKIVLIVGKFKTSSNANQS